MTIEDLPVVGSQTIGSEPIGGFAQAPLADPTVPTTADLPDNSEVGKRFDIAINGRGLMLDRRPAADRTRYRRRLSELEVARFNTESTANDLNATVDRYHFAGTREFEGGAGQQWANRDASVDNRYWNSHNIDPFHEGAARPLHKVVEAATTGAFRPRFCVVGDTLVYQTADARLAVQTTVGATPTVPDDLDSSIVGLVSDGRHWFAPTGSAIVRGTTTDATSVEWSTLNAYEIDYSATRMFVAHTETDDAGTEWNVFTSLDSEGNDERAAAGTVPSGHFRYNEFTRIYLGQGIERGRYFYAVAEGNVGAVWAWPISSGENYQGPVSVLQLPIGTVPTQVFCHGGFVWLRVATLLPNGKCRPAVWKCAVLDDGSLAPSVLIESDLEHDVATERDAKEFAAHGNKVYFSWANDVEEPAFAGAHLIAADLVGGGWAPSYSTTGTESFDVGIWNRQPVFAIENDGDHQIVTVSAAYVEEAVLETSIVDGGSDLAKYFADATVTTTPLTGSWRLRIEISTQRGLPTSWVEKAERGAGQGDPYAALTANIGGIAAQSLQLRIVLESDGAETEAPEINSHQLRYWVASLYDDELLVQIDCTDNVKDRNKETIPEQSGEGSGSATAHWLTSLMGTFVTVDQPDDQFARQREGYVRPVYEVKDVSMELVSADTGKALAEIAPYVTMLMRRSVTLGELGGALIPTPAVTASTTPTGGGGGVDLSVARLYPFLAQMLSAGTNITIDGDGANYTLTINGEAGGGSDTVRSDEEIRDVVAGMMREGAGIDITYDDPANTLTIAGTVTSLTLEQVRDAVAAFLRAGTNVTIDHDDAADTLTINSTGGGLSTTTFLALTDTPNTWGQAGQAPVVNATRTGLDWTNLADAGLTREEIRDLIASFLVAGTDISIEHDDDANTLTISVEVTDMAARTDEEIRDVIAGFLREGMNITLVHDDDADTLTISASIDKSFVDLTDTPAAIVANQMVVGNAAGTGLTFQAVPVNTDTQRTDEDIRDVVAAFLTEGTDISIVHNDAANTLTVSYTGTPGTGGTSQEEVRDLIGSTLVAGANITITPDDAADTVTIAATFTDTNTQRTDEDIRDVVGAALREGANISIAVDDTNDSITIAATDTNTQRSDEDIRDVIGTALREGTGIAIAVDDANDTIMISSTVVDTNTQRTDEEIRDLVAMFLRSGTNITIHHDDAANTLTINSTASGDGTSTDTIIKDTVTVSMERNNPRESAAADTLANSDADSIFAVGNGSAGSGPPIVGVEALEAVSVRLDYDASSSFDTTDGVTLDIFRGDTRVGYVRGQNFAGTSESAASEDWYWSTDLTVGNDHSTQSGGLNFFDVSGNAIDEIAWPTTGGYLTVRLRNNAITQNDSTYGAVTCRFRRASADFVGSIPSDFTDLGDTPNAITAGQMVVGNTAGDALTFQAVPVNTDTQRTDEDIRDVVAAQVQAGTGISVTEDDANDTLTIASTVVNTDTQRSDEDIRDVIAAMLQAGSNVTLNEDDANNTLTISATDTNTDTNTQRTDEDIRDVTAAQLQAGTGITVTEDDANNTLTIASTVVNTDTQRTNEEIRDVIAAALRGGTNVTVVHDDNADTITISSTDTDTQRSNEEIRDLIAGFLHGGTDITVTHDDNNDRLTIAYTGTPGTGGTSEEEVRDLIGSTLVEGANISITVNDAADTVTIAATDTNTQRTDEDIRDVIVAMLTAGSNITLTEDDANNTLTIAASGGTDTTRSDEDIRDVTAAQLQAGTGITLTEDDANNTLTIASTVVNTDTQRTDESVRDVVAAQLQAGANITITEDDANDTITIASTAGGSGVPATNPPPETVTLTTVTIPHGTGSNEAGVHSASVGSLITSWDASGVTLKAGQYFIEVEAAATGNAYRAAPVMRIEHADTDALLATTTYDYFRDDSAIRENVKLVTALHLTADTELRFDFRQMQYETDANLGQGVGGAITLTLPQVTFWATHGTKGDKGDPGTNASARTDEDIRDVVVALLTAGANITLTEDDANDTLTIAASGGSTGLNAEQVRDTIADALTDSDEIAWAHNDDADTIRAELKSDSVIAEHLAGLTGVLASDRGKLIALKSDDQTSFEVVDVPTDTNTQRTDQEIIDVVATMPMAGLGTSVAQHSDAGEITGFGINVSSEFLRDTIASFIAAGTDISVTHDDAGNTLTIAYTGTPGTGGTSEEEVRDLIGSTLQAGANITITVDDDNDTVTIAATDTGLTQTEVDARITSGYASTAFQQAVNQRIMDEAETGNTQQFPAGKIPEITTDKLANDAVTSDKLGDGSVGPSAIAWDLSQSVPVPTTDEGKLVAISDTGLGYTVFKLVDSPSGGLDAEGVRDTIGTALAGGTDISITVDDDNDTITVAYTGTPGTGGTSEEEVRDLIGSTLVAGANITITPDDANDTVTIAATFTDTNTQRSDEDIRDVVAAMLTAGAGITLTEDDANNTLTITGPTWQYEADDFDTQTTGTVTAVSLATALQEIRNFPTQAGNYVWSISALGNQWTNLSAHAGLSQAEVDARVQAGVLDEAEAGNTDVWPMPKLDAASDATDTFVGRVQEIGRADTTEPAWYTAPDIPDVADLPSGNGEYVATVSRNGAGDRVIGWGADIRTFLGLTDTPSGLGDAGQALVVDSAGTGLEFGSAGVDGLPAVPAGAGEYVLDVPTSGSNSWERQGTVDDTLRFNSYPLTGDLINMTRTSTPTVPNSIDAYIPLLGGSGLGSAGAPVTGVDALTGFDCTFKPASGIWTSQLTEFDVYKDNARIGSIVIDTPSSGSQQSGDYTGSTYYTANDAAAKKFRAEFRDLSGNAVDEVPWTGGGVLRIRLLTTGDLLSTTTESQVMSTVAATVAFRRTRGPAGAKAQPGRVEAVNVFWGPGQTERVPDNYTDVSGINRVGSNNDNRALRLTWQDPSGGANERYFSDADLANLYQSSVASNLNVDAIPNDSIPNDHVFGLPAGGLYTITVRVDIRSSQDDNRNRLFLMEAQSGTDDKLLATTSGVRGQDNFGSIQQGRVLELRYPYFNAGNTARNLYCLLSTGGRDQPNGGFRVNRHLMIERHET